MEFLMMIKRRKNKSKCKI